MNKSEVKNKVQKIFLFWEATFFETIRQAINTGKMQEILAQDKKIISFIFSYLQKIGTKF
ncbi:MAG: hypothetical protein WCP52_08170 [Bacteroidota bacterium]